MKRKFIHIAAIFALASGLSSCSGILDGIYDDAQPDSTFEEGFHGTESTSFTLRLDATSYDNWIYINLADRSIERMPIPSTLTGRWDGRSALVYQIVEGDRYTELDYIPTDTQAEPAHWDFAIHHFDVKTNGAEVAETPWSDLGNVDKSAIASLDFKADEWNDHQVITDLREMMGFKIGYQNSKVNPALTRWVTMDFSTPPPVYSATGRVYIMRLPSGELAALKMRSYMSETGTKGFLTIDITYPL